MLAELLGELSEAANRRLIRKVFVITGGNGGIGLGLAEGIAEAGGSVAIWARNEEKNAHAVKLLKDIGGRG